MAFFTSLPPRPRPMRLVTHPKRVSLRQLYEIFFYKTIQYFVA